MATVPVIEAADITPDGSDAPSTTLAIDYPAYVSGDFLAFLFGTDFSTATHTIPSTGPNGDEVINTIVDSDTSSGTGGPNTSGFWFKGTSTEAAGSLNVTISASEEFASHVVFVPTGEFDPDTPIQTAIATDGSGGSQETTVSTPAVTADAVADGKIVSAIYSDTDPITGTFSGWSVLDNTDQGRVGSMLVVRDAGCTSSESITAADFSIAGDTWASLIFIINAPPAAGGGRIMSSLAYSGGLAGRGGIAGPGGGLAA